VLFLLSLLPPPPSATPRPSAAPPVYLGIAPRALLMINACMMHPPAVLTGLTTASLPPWVLYQVRVVSYSRNSDLDISRFPFSDDPTPFTATTISTSPRAVRSHSYRLEPGSDSLEPGLISLHPSGAHVTSDSHHIQRDKHCPPCSTGAGRVRVFFADLATERVYILLLTRRIPAACFQLTLMSEPTG
jgi:hypothetical protein